MRRDQRCSRNRLGDVLQRKAKLGGREETPGVNGRASARFEAIKRFVTGERDDHGVAQGRRRQIRASHPLASRPTWNKDAPARVTPRTTARARAES